MQQQWKGQRNLLDVRFQVKVSVPLIFLLASTDPLKCFYPMFYRGVFQWSRGRRSKTSNKSSWGKTQVSHPFLLPLPQLSFSSAILGLLVFNPKFVRLLIATFVYSLIGESIYGSNSTRDKIMLALVRQ